MQEDKLNSAIPGVKNMFKGIEDSSIEDSSMRRITKRKVKT